MIVPMWFPTASALGNFRQILPVNQSNEERTFCLFCIFELNHNCLKLLPEDPAPAVLPKESKPRCPSAVEVVLAGASSASLLVSPSRPL